MADHGFVVCPCQRGRTRDPEPGCEICHGRGVVSTEEFSTWQLAHRWAADELRRVCMYCGTIISTGAPYAPTSHGICQSCAIGMGLEE